MDTLSFQQSKFIAMNGIREGLKPLRWLVARLYLPASALLAITGITILQLLLIGGFDRLGVSPQFSFLALNLFLILIFATGTLYPRLKTRQAQRVTVFNRTVVANEAEMTLSREFICKHLIIRRASNQESDSTSAPFNQRRINDQIVVQN
jgi:hypothetical protein